MNLIKICSLIAFFFVALFLFIVGINKWNQNNKSNKPSDVAIAKNVIEKIDDILTGKTAYSYNLDYADPVLLNSRTIFFTGHINPGSTRRLLSQLSFLDSQDINKPINLYLNSLGGWVSNGMAIAEFIQSMKAKVNTIALGDCSSSCVLILAAGTGERIASDTTNISVHVTSNKEGEKYSGDLVDRLVLERFYKKHLSLPESWFPMKEERNYALLPEEALELKIIDKIISRND